VKSKNFNFDGGEAGGADSVPSQLDIYSTYGEFLSGDKIDVGRRFYDVSVPAVVDRIDYLRARSERKKILHIGCLDHPEIISERIKDQTWLHGILSAVAEKCVGIDVEEQGYQFVQRELGIMNIRLLDLTRPLGESDVCLLRETHSDLILCPEVLEHITNHQQLLQNLWKISGPATRLLVTVPNAFQFGNFVNALRGFESINSDHKYWFTFYTLSRTLAANGWKPERLIYYNGRKGTHWMDILSRIATWSSRVFSDGLIVESVHLKSPGA
jgi:SAM-dependent methyltransferase